MNKLSTTALIAGTGLLGGGLGAASARPVLDRTIGPGYTDLDFEIASTDDNAPMHRNNQARAPWLIGSMVTGAGLGMGGGLLAKRRLNSQFAFGAKAARDASKQARGFCYGDFSFMASILDVASTIRPTPQMATSISNLSGNLHHASEAAGPIARGLASRGHKLYKKYKHLEPGVPAIKSAIANPGHLVPSLHALATTLPSPQEYLQSMSVLPRR